MTVSLQLGLDVIRSYKRLSYTPWHALAEFVDNSTQSYSNNETVLNDALARAGESFEVSIAYDRNGEGLLRIADNAMGMSLGELEYALRIGAPPAISTGRSKYGLGMKLAGCWFGDLWTIRTSKLGEDVEREITVDVELVAAGENELLPVERPADADEHYTIIEISRLNRRPQGRTLGKIRDFLRSMYRLDLTEGSMRLLWQGEPLQWDPDEGFLKAQDGKPYRKDFEFVVNGKEVRGWIGVLERGSRAKAGFSMLHARRVVSGWPEAWRPEPIFGQLLGTNDLVNQRLTGEVYLDAFDVSTTKDDILWLGNEQEEVERELAVVCSEYREVARTHRKRKQQRGPGDLEVQTAVEEFQHELNSDLLADILTLEQVPPPDVVQAELAALLSGVDPTDPSFSASMLAQGNEIRILGYLTFDTSSNDPYVVSESTSADHVIVVINMNHPHLQQVNGSDGLLNYFRHCTYDALAEWQAWNRAASIDPSTIKLLKDRLLRLPMSIEMHEARAEEAS